MMPSSRWPRVKKSRQENISPRLFEQCEAKMYLKQAKEALTSLE